MQDQLARITVVDEAAASRTGKWPDSGDFWVLTLDFEVIR
jgi:hypothetical protein